MSASTSTAATAAARPNEMRVDELKSALTERGLDTRGLKPELVERLTVAMDREAASTAFATAACATRAKLLEPNALASLVVVDGPDGGAASSKPTTLYLDACFVSAHAGLVKIALAAKADEATIALSDMSSAVSTSSTRELIEPLELVLPPSDVDFEAVVDAMAWLYNADKSADIPVDKAEPFLKVARYFDCPSLMDKCGLVVWQSLETQLASFNAASTRAPIADEIAGMVQTTHEFGLTPVWTSFKAWLSANTTSGSSKLVCNKCGEDKHPSKSYNGYCAYCNTQSPYVSKGRARDLLKLLLSRDKATFDVSSDAKVELLTCVL